MLIDRVIAHARRRPDAPAVIEDGEVACTYAQLVERAAPPAGSGVAAIELPRSAAWIAAALGAWRAGRPFAPIDPGLPAARRARMRARLAAIERPAELAYVIFTSGSTGRPKAVEVTHRGVANVLAQQAAAFEVGADSRVAWLLSPAFDASLSDVGVALWAGAAVVIESSWPLGPGLLDRIGERRVSHADLPPSLLPHLDPARRPACLETVVIGGEVADPAAVRRWAGAVRLLGAYGPTETTICSSLVRCTPDWSRPLIGRPLAGVRYRMVDGQLAIGGLGVARGYAGDPELTAERFIELDGERWFVTGDRVRPAGDDHEYLGRVDRQLKIAGRLIAPEEVEAALRDAGGGEVAVFARRAGARDVLCARYTGDLSFEALRAAAAETLPAWMLPGAGERVGALPRTATGKLDRSAPMSERQAAIAALWTEVLGVAPRDPGDDFFALGGDSLAAVALIAAAEVRGLALSPEALGGAWTLEAMAAEARPTASIRTADLARDAAWTDAELAAFAAAGAPGPLRSVLVTGATGFLGRHLIPRLLDRGLVVSCLVRGDAPDGTEGVHGDLAAPRLGLDAATWDRLARTTDAVIHLGARLDVLRPYAELRAVNLGGTKEIVRLAAAGRPKALHLASTLSVFAATDHRGACLESDDLVGADRAVYGGYAQSKVAAELAVRAAGLPATAIYRLGLLTGAAAGPCRFPERHWLRLFVRGAAELGALPLTAAPLAVDITPVDHAAATLAAHLDAPPTTVHVANRRGATLDELAAAIERAGVRLERLEPAAWRARVRRAAPAPETAAALLGGVGADHGFDLFAATGRSFVAGDRGCPPVTAALLDRYVEAMLEGPPREPSNQ